MDTKSAKRNDPESLVLLFLSVPVHRYNVEEFHRKIHGRVHLLPKRKLVLYAVAELVNYYKTDHLFDTLFNPVMLVGYHLKRICLFSYTKYSIVASILRVFSQNS